jgi:hypothetical protein
MKTDALRRAAADPPHRPAISVSEPIRWSRSSINGNKFSGGIIGTSLFLARNGKPHLAGGVSRNPDLRVKSRAIPIYGLHLIQQYGIMDSASKSWAKLSPVCHIP